MGVTYKSPRWREIENSPAVEMLANFGFRMEDIGGDDVVLVKETLGGLIIIAKTAYGPSRPPEKLSDPVSMSVENRTEPTQPFLWLKFKSVRDLIWSLGPRV